MSYEFYRVLHLFSVFGVTLSLGGMTIFMAAGGSKASFTARKFVAVIHGIGLFLALVGGFGLLARLGLVQGLPGWAIAKIVLWLALGGLPVLVYKKPQHAKAIFIGIWLLTGLAAYLARYKPF
jgi:hypothetical protein